MLRWVRLLLSGIIVAAMSCEAHEAHAGHPSYLLLQSPPVDAPRRHNFDWPGYGQGVSTQSYAYGWFGAKPSTQWTRHFGYHRNYTQWSSR